MLTNLHIYVVMVHCMIQIEYNSSWRGHSLSNFFIDPLLWFLAIVKNILTFLFSTLENVAMVRTCYSRSNIANSQPLRAAQGHATSHPLTLFRAFIAFFCSFVTFCCSAWQNMILTALNEFSWLLSIFNLQLIVVSYCIVSKSKRQLWGSWNKCHLRLENEATFTIYVAWRTRIIRHPILYFLINWEGFNIG